METDTKDPWTQNFHLSTLFKNVYAEQIQESSCEKENVELVTFIYTDIQVGIMRSNRLIKIFLHMDATERQETV